MKRAMAEIDQVGQIIGATNLGAKGMILQNLADAFQACQAVTNAVDKRSFSFRRKFNMLTPEELASLSAPAAPPGEGGESASEG